MKKGQVLCSHYHKGKAILTKVGKTNVEMTWFVNSNGTPSDIVSCFSVKEIQKELDNNGLTISDPDDPNIIFLMQRCKSIEF